jgi:hypothetical protein
VSADGGGAGLLVLGVVGTEAGEDVQRALSVVASRLGLADGMVCVGEAVVGAGLVCRLPELGRELGRPLVVAAGVIRVTGGVVDPAQALVRLEVPIRVIRFLRDGEKLPKVLGGSPDLLEQLDNRTPGQSFYSFAGGDRASRSDKAIFATSSRSLAIPTARAMIASGSA